MVKSVTFIDKYGATQQAIHNVGGGYMVAGRMASTSASFVSLLSRFVSRTDAEAIAARL